MAETAALRRTPLHAVHQDLDARMMGFGGYDMPVQYEGILAEHAAVRERAGLFDVSHMGEVEVRGPHAFAFVQHLVTNDASKLYDGRAQYNAMCHERGGIVDDLLVYRLAEDRYLLVINAACAEKDLAWMHDHNSVGAELVDVSDETALIALQGPKSFSIAARVAPELPLGDLKYYHFLQPEPGTFLGCEHALISRTGYTGEKGLELYVEADRAVHVWNALMEAGQEDGLLPTGLGARDTLRLEAGYNLYGQDMDEETNPFEAGLGWITKLDKDGDFVGRAALERIQAEGPQRKLVGFVLEDRGIPRHGYALAAPDGGEAIGVVTSGSQSPTLGKGIGLGYVPNDPMYTREGARLDVQVRGRSLAATVQKPPFHK